MTKCSGIFAHAVLHWPHLSGSLRFMGNVPLRHHSPGAHLLLSQTEHAHELWSVPSDIIQHWMFKPFNALIIVTVTNICMFTVSYQFFIEEAVPPSRRKVSEGFLTVRLPKREVLHEDQRTNRHWSKIESRDNRIGSEFRYWFKVQDILYVFDLNRMTRHWKLDFLIGPIKRDGNTLLDGAKY